MSIPTQKLPTSSALSAMGEIMLAKMAASGLLEVPSHGLQKTEAIAQGQYRTLIKPPTATGPEVGEASQTLAVRTFMVSAKESIAVPVSPQTSTGIEGVRLPKGRQPETFFLRHVVSRGWGGAGALERLHSAWSEGIPLTWQAPVGESRGVFVLRSSRSPMEVYAVAGFAGLGAAAVVATNESRLVRVLSVVRTNRAAQLMQQLAAVADAGDAERFQKIAAHINWERTLPENFVQIIKLGLRAGALLQARRIANIGIADFPEHRLLRKCWELLEQPKITQSRAKPVPTMESNVLWLARNRTRFKGRWVALQNGDLLGDADSLDALRELVGNVRGIQGLLVTRIQ